MFIKVLRQALHQTVKVKIQRLKSKECLIHILCMCLSLEIGVHLVCLFPRNTINQALETTIFQQVGQSTPCSPSASDLTDFESSSLRMSSYALP